MNDQALAPGYSRLTLTNEVQAPALACAHVVQVARQLGFSDDEIASIELGVEEAAANVVRHAFAQDELGSFDIICVPTALGLEVRISDQGLPFDPNLLPDFDPESPLLEYPAGGLGTFLMRQAFDVVTFRNLGRSGKETCLIKYHTHAPISAYAAPMHAPADTEADATVHVRRINSSEAIEVSRCVYEAYGYSYPYEHIYYPERIAALNESGEIISAVAVTASGRIAGHAALVKDNHGGAELAIAVTRPIFRGQGIARKMGDFLLKEAQTAGLKIVFAQAVTNHTYTQQFCQALGFRECALLPGHAPASLQFRNITDQLQQRESCILAVKSISDIHAHMPLYAPAMHQPVIEELYSNLGLSPEWSYASPDTAQLPQHTIMSVNAATSLELGLIRIDTWGADCTIMLKQRLQQLRRERYAIAQLLLPLWQPACAGYLHEIEEIGFFFSGIFPQSTGKDWLMMHHLLDTTIDYNRLNIHSAIGQMLLSYVKQQDTFNNAN